MWMPLFLAPHVSTQFAYLMQSKFEMSMVGELNFFLSLQVKQLKDGIFVSQTKYARELVKHFGFDLENTLIPL